VLHRTIMADKPEGPGEIALLLDDWARGKAGAVDQLLPLVYDQLRRLAQSLLRNERSDHTLESTALVNEMFGQLLRQRKVSLKDRGHFYTFSAKLMRRLLVDHARQFRAAKRGSTLTRDRSRRNSHGSSLSKKGPSTSPARSMSLRS